MTDVDSTRFDFLAGIRRSHVYLVVALLATTIAAAIYSYRSIDKELTEAALARRAALSYLASAVLAEKFDRLIDIGVSLASRVRFRQLVEQGKWNEAGKILTEVPADFPFIDRITINDTAGTLVADAPAALDVKGRNFAHRDWYQAVMRTGRPYISQVYMRSAVPQMNVFVAAVPIRSANGATLGLLVLQVRSDRFFEWIGGVDAGTGGTVYVVDRGGMLAAHPQFAVSGELIDYSAVPVVQQMLQGKRGVEIVANAAAGDERVVAYEPIARHGWGVVLEQPGKAAFAVRDDQLRRVLIAYALIASFMLFVAYLASRMVVQHRRALEDGRVNAELRETARTLEREIAERERTEQELAVYSERLNILHEIDRAIMAADAPEAIAETALQRLGKLIDVPRTIVNLFDLAANEAEWLAAVGRRRVHRGPRVRFSMRLMGDVESLRKGEVQVIDTAALPAGPEVDALLASGVEEYMVVPMIARGELIGGLSFGGAKGQFPMEHLDIVKEVAAQLAIAIAQARLYDRVKGHAEELEVRVAERTAQLREREERFRLMVSAVKDYAILMLDTQGRVVTWNEGAERIKGYRADEIVGQHFSCFYSREDRANDKPAKLLDTAAAKGRAEDEGWRVRKDGSAFWASVVITAVKDESGSLRGYSKVTRDLTQQKAAEAEIRQLNDDLESRAAQLEVTNKELEGFSYSVSHDLRSPLRAVDGYSQMLEEDYADKLDEEGRRLLAVIRESSRKMATLIDDLLNFSRLGRRAIQMSAVDMNALLAEVIRDVRTANGGTALPIKVADVPKAQGDRALLKQVWINLVTNALKFSDGNATPAVEISATSTDAEIVYRVKDNGVGFDMKYYNKLFGVFQRLHSADEFPGTGVGLAIVHRVVSRHGGRVWAEGKLNHGAAFFFALPPAQEQATEPETGEQVV